MATKLHDLEITEISGVDKGANPGAKAVLVKRDFSQDQRNHLADTGAAMPDGSFPIQNATDLHNAIRAIGRAKDTAAVRKHIIRRAKSLGITAQLPEDWKVSKSTVEKLLSVFWRAHQEDVAKAKGKPTAEDPDGDGDNDRTTDPDKNPDAAEDAKNGTLAKSGAAGAAGNPVSKGDDSMTDFAKALAAKDAEIAKLKAELEKAKKPMTEEEEKAEKERCEKAALAALPESVRKQLADVEVIKKQNAELVEKAEVAEFTKRCSDLGLPADFVPHLRTISKADPKAAEAVATLAKQLQGALKASPLFKELGSAGGPDVTSAFGQLESKADEIAKADSKVTKAQAFAKACETNPALFNQYQAERAAALRS